MHNSGKETVHLIHIIVRPEISIASKTSAVEGQDVVLYCKIIASNPLANISWLNPDGKEIFSANGTVYFQSVNRKQNGLYYCLASNGIGSVASKATYVLVNCKCCKLYGVPSHMRTLRSM